jgi:hypothetical protein
MVERIQLSISSGSGLMLGGRARRRGQCLAASARWPDPVALGEGHLSSMTSWSGARYVWVGSVFVGGHRNRGSLVERHWREDPAWGVETVVK